jgi:FkbM family methyltransferase
MLIIKVLEPDFITTHTMQSLREEVENLVGVVDGEFLRSNDMKTYFQNKHGALPDLIIFFWFSSCNWYENIRKQLPNCKIAVWSDDVHNVGPTCYKTYGQCDAHICHYPNHIEYFFGEPLAPKIKLPHSPSSYFLADKINFGSINKILFYGVPAKVHYPERRWFVDYMKQNRPDKLIFLGHPGYVSGPKANTNTAQELSKYSFSYTAGGLPNAGTLPAESKAQYYLTGKFFEIPASGSLLLCNEARLQVELAELGFKDMVNCVFINESNIETRLNWLFDPINIGEINAIRRAGFNFIHEKHTLKKHIGDANNQLIELAQHTKTVDNIKKPLRSDLCLAVNSDSIQYINDYFWSMVELFNCSYCIYKQNQEFVFEPGVQYVFFATAPKVPSDFVKNVSLLNVNNLECGPNAGRSLHIKDCVKSGIKILSYSFPDYFTKVATMIHFPTIIFENDILNLKKLTKNNFDYDFALYGQITPHKEAIVLELKKLGYKIIVIGKVLDDERDAKIASAKILLNLNSSEKPSVYDSIVYDRWLGAGKLILSEKCYPGSYYGSDQFMFVAETDKIVSTAKNLLENFASHQKNRLQEIFMMTDNAALLRKMNTERLGKCFDILASKFEFKVQFGNTDQTNLVLKKNVDGFVIVPPGKENRKLFFEADPGDLIITFDGETKIYHESQAVQIKILDDKRSDPKLSVDKVEYINAFVPEDKLGVLHDKLKFEGNIKIEVPEQIMALIYVTPESKVLELGSNIGRNTCIIASCLSDSANLVTMETIPETFAKLEENRKLNNFKFKSINAALSYKPLIQTGWDSKPLDTMDIPKGYCKVATKTYDEIESETKIKFNVLVADCEGALYYIFKDKPDILDSIHTVIMENDYHDISNKKFIDSVLKSKGLACVYVKSGGWGPCYKNFYEVWQKVK